ncbi:hypothetical protein L211DRAFT_844497 [Terfezia boudieri ATCC MYA-4762]|uniref:Uncharacterized protein n=1 Tax=Terfezia boudieri ATCC MYA-4762 TaxID=1051890 RepID=A0A3N4MP42_9PEZI|nr:hypothetical protein L211DRAFT_844497 [Terfezia boudieri ATCC MYA-4762]
MIDLDLIGYGEEQDRQNRRASDDSTACHCLVHEGMAQPRQNAQLGLERGSKDLQSLNPPNRHRDHSSDDFFVSAPPIHPDLAFSNGHVHLFPGHLCGANNCARQSIVISNPPAPRRMVPTCLRSDSAIYLSEREKLPMRMMGIASCIVQHAHTTYMEVEYLLLHRFDLHNPKRKSSGCPASMELPIASTADRSHLQSGAFYPYPT